MATPTQFGTLPPGLPPGVLLRPLKRAGKSAGQQAGAIAGLPEGALLRPIQRVSGSAGQQASPKPVLHSTNDVEALRASAERQAPALGNAVSRATESVPGAKLEAVRDSKDTDRIEEKAQRQGVSPSQIGDIAAAKVTVPDQAAAGQVVENLNREMPVERAEGAVTGAPGKNGVRQVQTVVHTGKPGEPVQHAEVLLQTPEMNQATDKTHDDYRAAQEARAAGDNATADRLEAKAAKTHEAAAQKAEQRVSESARQPVSENTPQGGSKDAVQEQGAGSVLQRTPQEDGSAGSERGRVEQGERRTDDAGARETAAASQAEGITPRAAGRPPVPPERLRAKPQAEDARTMPSGKTLWKAGRQSTPVMVKDADSNWLHATLEHFNPGFNGGQPSARVTLANGYHMRNVRPADMKLTSEDTRQAKAGDEWIGVDLDGTLARYDGYKGKTVIGAPVTEMVDRVKNWLSQGKDVRIFSARVSDDPGGHAQAAIDRWSEKHIGRKLPITNVKDDKMTALYDDRAASVERNTGKVLSPPQPMPTDMGNKLMAALKASAQRKTQRTATA